MSIPTTFIAGSATMNFEAWVKMLQAMSKMIQTQLLSIGSFYGVARDIAGAMQTIVKSSGQAEAEGQRKNALFTMIGGGIGVGLMIGTYAGGSYYQGKATAATTAGNAQVNLGNATPRGTAQMAGTTAAAPAAVAGAAPGAQAHVEGSAGRPNTPPPAEEIDSTNMKDAKKLAKSYRSKAGIINQYGHTLVQPMTSFASGGGQMAQSQQTVLKSEQDGLAKRADGTSEQTRSNIQLLQDAKQTAQEMERLANEAQAAIRQAQSA
jgi:hypothetical protein